MPDAKYAALPMVAVSREVIDTVTMSRGEFERLMRAFADATHALRTAHVAESADSVLLDVAVDALRKLSEPAHVARPQTDAVADAAEALRPFAEIGAWLFARPHVPDDETVVGINYLNGFRTALTRGQFKEAHRALQSLAAREAQATKDAEDAPRLDWLTFNISGKALRDIGVIWSEHGDARRAIDAARAKQEER